MDEKIKLVFNFIKENKWDDVEKILDANKDMKLNYRDKNKNHLLNYIVIYNKINILKKIIDRNILLDIIDQNGLVFIIIQLNLIILKL